MLTYAPLAIWYATVYILMSQVIIVSARLPVGVKKKDGQLSFSPSVGGLATGLSSYVNNPRNIWVGWPGIAEEELTEEDKQTIIIELAKHHCSPVFLSRKQIEGFYNGYSNDVLWPNFHDLKYVPKDSATHNRWWRAYRSVNQEFSDAVLSVVRDRSHIWVHDYQLMLLPQLLRNDLPDVNIGFFLHIPFPSHKTFSKIPEYKKLLDGILASDLIGFHVNGYTDNFVENTQEFGYSLIGENKLLADDRVVRIAEFPMGIDYNKYATARKSSAVKAAIRRYRKKYRGLKVIAAVDRVDPSKGLLERLRAYRQLLQQTPKLRGKVVFAMIAAPSRTEVPAYIKLSKQLQVLVNDINTEFGTARWEPVDYMYEAKPFEEVSALFAIADVAFIAPIRDGMNLAAKEFIASKRSGGTLILSETAGAASELHDALLVNPKQQAGVVEALQESLKMPRREVRKRMKRMQKQLAENTVQDWAKSFVDTLQTPVLGTRPRAKTLRDARLNEVVVNYQLARKRLLLLDYDGSLVPFKNDFKSVDPPKAVLKLLKGLKADARNDVVLVSGRSQHDLQPWFGKLGINLVGEHGAVSQSSGTVSWKTNEQAENRWKKIVLPTLEFYAEETPGAHVENKPNSLVWHYRNASPYYAQKHIVLIKRVLRPILSTYGLQLSHGNKILEIKDPRLNKGWVASRWIKKNKYDFILAIGDDFTDEELFKALPASAVSVKVGRGSTIAQYRLTDYKDTRAFLKKLL